MYVYETNKNKMFMYEATKLPETGSVLVRYLITVSLMFVKLWEGDKKAEVGFSDSCWQLWSLTPLEFCCQYNQCLVFQVYGPSTY